MKIGSVQLGGSGWFAGVCAPACGPHCEVRDLEPAPLIREVTGDIRKEKFESREERTRLPAFWAHLERENLERTRVEGGESRERDSVELGSGGRLERLKEMGAERGEEDRSRRYGAARVGDVSPARAAERVAEVVRKVYRADVVATGTLADVLG